MFAYLSNFTEVRQLVKLPNLLEHYITHKLLNENMSMYAFFKMHYLDEQIVDSDYQQDLQLPFKTHDLSSTLITINIPPEKTAIKLQHHLMLVDYSDNFSYSEKFFPSVFQKIWEPPQI